jgi:hypothetical protein
VIGVLTVAHVLLVRRHGVVPPFALESEATPVTAASEAGP